MESREVSLSRTIELLAELSSLNVDSSEIAAQLAQTLDESVVVRLRDQLNQLSNSLNQQAEASDRTFVSIAEVDSHQRSESGNLEVSLSHFGEKAVNPAQIRLDRVLSQNKFSDRYNLGKEVARGGVGVINQAFETRLRRDLVIKRLISQSEVSDYVLAKFVEEAQITAQLEHPNIVPVHDIGVTEAGDLYFSMKYVDGDSLKRVLKRLRAADPTTLAAYPRIRMLSIFQGVCRALAFAHSKGVIDRDIKPANVMLGEFGETLLLDWGVAKVLGEKASEEEQLVSTSRTQTTDETQMGLVTGTPAYMAPEQAAGRIDRLNQKTDIFALGALLYELLTYRSPFRKASQRETLRAVIVDEPPPFDSWSEVSPVSDKLAQICLRCLRKRPRDRYDSVNEILADLLQYLEGVEEVDRRRRRSQENLQLGLKAVREFEAVDAKLRAAQASLTEGVWETPTFAPLEHRRRIWTASAQCAALHVQVEKKFTESVNRLAEAVSLDESNDDAANELARLYWTKLKQSEQGNDPAAKMFFRDAVKRFDRGLFRERLKGEGRLVVQSAPMDALVSVQQVVEMDLRLTPSPPLDIGKTPILNHVLREGRWLVTLSKPGYADANFPITIRRGETTEIESELVKEAAVYEHFLYVPAGACTVGGDPVCASAQASQVRNLDAFQIARYPVTCAEYLAFLNAIDAEDPRAAQLRVPRMSRRGGFLWQRDAQRRFVLPTSDSRGFGWEPHYPVVGISFEDANAFCEWFGNATQRRIRLPSEFEWEKSARGSDERAFPWGDTFDPYFCKTADSRAGESRLERVGSFAYDCSPYGIYDMAGLVSEFTSTRFSKNDQRVVVKGANYQSQGGAAARASFRAAFDEGSPSLRVGFRLVSDFKG